MAKKKNSRKALAAALGIMGIAGLSVASASQLDITTSPDNLATGSQIFAAACDDAVSVAYTTNTTAAGVVTYTGYTVSGISATCVGKTLTATVGYSTYSATPTPGYTAATPLTTAPAVAIAAGNSGANALTVTWASPLAGSSKLDNIAITIK